MRDIFAEVLSTLRQNKLRTALTGLAVTWGLLIIIVLIGTGNGLMNALMSNASGEIKNIIRVWPGETSKPYHGIKEGTAIRLGIKDLAFSKDFSDKIDGAYETQTFSDTLKLGKETVSSEMTGTDPDLRKRENLNIVAGRFINNVDINETRKSIVIDEKVASQLLGDAKDGKNIIGQNIVVGDIPFLVVGLTEAPEGSWGHESYVPISTVKKMRSGSMWMSSMDLMFHGIETEKESEDFEKSYKHGINTIHGADPGDDNTVYVWNMYLQQKEMTKAMRIMRTALWILGLLTLLSGIVGVSNIMLITVKERIHEFGIRKALGATPASILNLIVVESIVITAIFGYLGMSLGMLANHFLDTSIGSSPMDIGFTQIYLFKNIGVGLDVALKATLLLIVAGTLAGIIPAWKGARVRPIEALRAEK